MDILQEYGMTAGGDKPSLPGPKSGLSLVKKKKKKKKKVML